MINRQNWKDTNSFLAYQSRIRQNGDKTIIRHRVNLRHILEWAGNIPFEKARGIEPTLPAYLSSAVGQSAGHLLAPATFAKVLLTARQFFTFARLEWPTRYKSLSESWINSLQPNKARGIQSRLKSHAHYSVDDIKKIAGFYSSADLLMEKRDIAAACFLFLSGMRIDAFCSLPISCVDLPAMRVIQDPERGVRTKNHKAAETYLLNIESLLSVVVSWDKLVRSELSKDDLWYPVMNRTGEKFEKGRRAIENRGASFGHSLRAMCEKSEVDYLSPHKLRHGHAVYALKGVKDMAGLKAVSQNLMHNSVTITDGVYGGLSGADVADVYSKIGGLKNNNSPVAPQLDQKAMQELFSNPAFVAFVAALKQNG